MKNSNNNKNKKSRSRMSRLIKWISKYNKKLGNNKKYNVVDIDHSHKLAIFLRFVFESSTIIFVYFSIGTLISTPIHPPSSIPSSISSSTSFS